MGVRAAAQPIASALAMEVLASLQDLPMTCDEFETLTGMKHQTASARFSELKAKGLITPTGTQRKTRSGCNAMVYAAQTASRG